MQRALRLPNRDGTDYGAQDVPLATKVFQVHQQLDAGTAVLVYDEDTESCTISPRTSSQMRRELPQHEGMSFFGPSTGVGRARYFERAAEFNRIVEEFLK
jgi:uncharacterized protein YheU (UPF0270 family)